MSDEQDLVRRCVRGDQAAFAELVNRYKLMVFNLADRTVGDAGVSDDLAQEVFVRVYQGLPGFRGEARLSTWIYQIAYRVCLEELKRPHRRQPHVRLDETDASGKPRRREPAYTSDRGVARVDAQEALDRWLAELPPQYRMALTLYYLQERRYEEVASIMEVPVGTVKTYLHRAKQYLRERVIEEEQRNG